MKQIIKTTSLTAVASAMLMLNVNAFAGEGDILVQPKPGMSEQALEKIVHAFDARLNGGIEQIGVRLISVPDHARQALLTALQKNPHISFAETDERVPLQAIPDDPSFGFQWHHNNLQSQQAWDSAKADGINIAILDTGVDPDHPDLVNKLLSGWNSSSNNNVWMDIAGHGTKVAGAAAATANNGTGVAGVAWNANIIPVRVTDDSSGYAYFSAIAAGLTWAADNGADVANISYAVTGVSTVESAAAYLRGKGGLTVASAGNSGTDIGRSDSVNIITVSATDGSDNKTSWFSYGIAVDVAAPGSNIWTTVNGGTYGGVSGTSFSSPVAAGVLALIKGVNPALTASEVENILESTADDKGASGFDSAYGHGRINAAAAVQMALNSSAGDDLIAPSVSLSAPAGEVIGQLLLDVAANDNVAVSDVALYINGQLLARDNSHPYSFSWDSSSVADGSVQIKAVATDSSGNSASDVINVVVNNVPDAPDDLLPEITLISPQEGDAVSGKIIVQATATDNVAVSIMSCHLDGRLVSSVSGSSIDCIINARKLSLGDHTVEVRAYDAANNLSSKLVNITLVEGGGKTGGSTDGGSKGPGKKR